MTAHKDDPAEAIRNLKDGESWVWPESDYGKAEIWKKNDHYFVFEIPMYGGDPMYALSTDSVNEIVKEVESWT